MSELPEDRLRILEERLAFDERIQKIEANIGIGKNEPWWRNSISVPIVVACISAIAPSIVAIDGHFKNERDAERLRIEQAHTIRQVYLDRALKPGLSEEEKYNIFRLLVKIKEDSVIHDWADDNLRESTRILFEEKRKVGILNKKVDSLIVLAKRAPVSERGKFRAQIRQLKKANGIEDESDTYAVFSGFCGQIVGFPPNLMIRRGGSSANLTFTLEGEDPFGISQKLHINPSNRGFCVEVPNGSYNLVYNYNNSNVGHIRFIHDGSQNYIFDLTTGQSTKSRK